MIYKISTETLFFRATGGFIQTLILVPDSMTNALKKMVFITKGISIIFVRLILKNVRKCTHKTDTVYLEFERNSLVFEVNFDANYCQNIGVLLQREVGTNVCEDAINIYQC